MNMCILLMLAILEWVFLLGFAGASMVQSDLVLEDVLRSNCTIVRTINRYHSEKNDEENGQTYMQFSDRKIAAKYAVLVAKLGNCFDFVYDTEEMLATEGDLPIRARNSRYIFSGDALANNSKNNWPANTSLQGLDETVLILETDQVTTSTRLTLSCPAYNQSRYIHYSNRVLDVRKDGSWMIGPQTFTKPYKHCNPYGKNFYWNQDLVFVGFPGSGLMVLQEHMFRLLGKTLGVKSARVVHSTVYGLFDAKGNINLKTIFGQVLSGVADIVGNNLATPVTINYADFAAFKTDTMYFITGKPKILPQVWNLLYVLDNLTWFLFGSCLVIVTLAFLFSGKINAMKMSNLFFMPYGILFTETHFSEFNWGQVGKYVKSGILVKIIWLFCSSLLVMAYNGNLLASLTVKNYEKSVDTLEEMVATDEPIYGVYISNRSHYEHDPWWFHRAWYKNVKKHVGASIHPHQHPPRVRELMKNEVGGGFLKVCSCDNYPYQEFYQLEQQKKDSYFPIVMVKQKYETLQIPFTMKKYLSYNDEIIETTRKFRYYGISTAMERRLQYQYPKMEVPAENNEVKLNIDHLLVVLTIMVVMTIVSSLVFAWEYRSKNKNKKNKILLMLQQS